MNMKPHITMARIEAFRRGELPKEDLVSVATHLRDCDDCSARFEAVRTAANALIDDLTGFEHPEVEELFAYADGELDAARRNGIAGHLRDCAQCREDVGDATRERNQLHAITMWPRLAAAAAAVIVLGSLAFWFTQQRQQPANPVSHPVVIHVPSPRAPGEWDSLVAEARQTGKVATPAIIRQLRGESDTYRGSLESPASLHLSPAGTVVVSQQPEFTWRANEGERYVVSVACDEALAEKSEPVAGGRWTPAHSLPRGVNCTWQLERLRDHEIFPPLTAPQPELRILGEAALNAIRKAESQQPRDEFVIALLYAHAGAQKEAEAHLRTYIAEHPSDAVASRILESIERW
jgi:anti-sigma factor ChrR (cupin superfamily)